MLVEERAAPVYKAVSADRSGMMSQEGKRRNTQPLPGFDRFQQFPEQFDRDFPNMSMMTQAQKATMAPECPWRLGLEVVMEASHCLQNFSMRLTNATEVKD